MAGDARTYFSHLLQLMVSQSLMVEHMCAANPKELMGGSLRSCVTPDGAYGT